MLIALLSFNACEMDDDVVFKASSDDSIAFTNTFLTEYVLTPATSGNIGERFTWNSIDVGVPTNLSYDLEKSISGNFDTDGATIGTTSGNEIAITIGDMLGFANEAGLDNDPSTDNPDTGEVHFRIKAYAGDGGVPSYSASQALTLHLPEESSNSAVCDNDQLFLVGAGLPFTGWDWASPSTVICNGTNVYSGNIHLDASGDANFRFFTTATDWGSGLNYPYFEDAGFTIDSNFENAADGDSNFKFIGTSGFYNLTVDMINKTITLSDPASLGNCDYDQLWAVGAGLPDAGWDWATPVQLMCEGDNVYQGFLNLDADGDANFRFFTTATDWGSGLNYPYFEDAGFTIDSNFENAGDGDSNFKFIGTTGGYFISIDMINKTITLE